MRIDYLMYFLNVAQSKSINISAKELYISPQLGDQNAGAGGGRAVV